MEAGCSVGAVPYQSCVGGESGTPGVGVQLDSLLVVGVAVAEPQDLCDCSCRAFRAGSSSPLEQRALKASALFVAQSYSSFSICSLFKSVGSTSSIPPFFLVGTMLFHASVAILLVQDVQQCMPFPHHVGIWELLQILPGLEPEESLELFHPDKLLGITPLLPHGWF